MTTPAAPSRGAIILAFATIYIVWGSTYLGIRVAVETIPPVLMASMRFAVAGILLFSFLKIRGAAWPTLDQWKHQSVIGIFLLLGGNAVVSWCELRTPSGITALVLGASPVLMVFVDWVRPGGKRPTVGLGLGVAVGIVGLALLLGPGAIPAGQEPPIIDIVALILSSLSWWIGSFYSKHVKTGTPLLMASAMQMLVGSAVMLLAGSMLGEGRAFNFSAISPHSWMAFSYLVVVGSIVAFPTYIWLLEHSTPAKVSSFAYANPVIAVFLGWLILGEPMNLRVILATLVIVGAVVIITVGRTRVSATA